MELFSGCAIANSGLSRISFDTRYFLNPKNTSVFEEFRKYFNEKMEQDIRKEIC